MNSGKLRGSIDPDQRPESTSCGSDSCNDHDPLRSVMRLFLILALLSLVSCRTTTQKLRNMYENSLDERLGGSNFATLGPEYREHQETRLEHVREFVREEQLVTAEDYLYAGALLSTSSQQDDLIAASASGLKAAELGEDLGFRVAAEAIDKLAMHNGENQRYGTQYYYVEVIQKWRLYPIDPATTDEERKAMGVEPLSELIARVDLLNEEVR